MTTTVDAISPPARRPEPGPPPTLPYGPVTRRVLRPLQRGFLVLNRGFMAPLARRGLGWLVGSPLTGHIMVLRTRGRRSGRVREAPLGYVIRDGAVYCVAGYGTPTPWFRNLIDDPAVEVILPTRRFRGVAAPVDPRDEWLAAYRALISSFGLVGRAVVGDIHRMDDAELLARHRVLPVVRIRPADGEPPVTPGAFDPGGHGWLIPWAATIGALIVLGCWAGRRASRAAGSPDRAP
ncbi:MAG: nitroreductase family deazaflavin-dependent oxidoreductase [Chloroflexota bacterium]|nr:nitroreductase family deazaflavin-dependent oxidoreductase [Chloroflexota bacterium]